MGCDIHMWVERREADGKWHLVPDAMVYNERWYVLFGWLAGVRGYGPPIAERRGWPADISEALSNHLTNPLSVDKRLDSPGDHTPSWLNVLEIEEAYKLLPKNGYDKASQESFYEFFHTYCRYWKSLAQGDATKVRIVFNFDS